MNKFQKQTVKEIKEAGIGYEAKWNQWAVGGLLILMATYKKENGIIYNKRFTIRGSGGISNTHEYSRD